MPLFFLHLLLHRLSYKTQNSYSVLIYINVKAISLLILQSHKDMTPSEQQHYIRGKKLPISIMRQPFEYHVIVLLNGHCCCGVVLLYTVMISHSY